MNRRTQREAGDVTSWALGVTAGLVLGVTLLIATPRLMAPATTAEETTTSTTTRDAAAQAGSADTQEAASQGTAGQQQGATAEGATTAAEGAPAEGAATEGEATQGAEEAGAAGNAQAGQTVYVGNCAGCHGANGQGQIGPSLVGEDGPGTWTLAQFTATLRDGQTPDRELSASMPRFSEAQISDQQVADLQAYIKTLN